MLPGPLGALVATKVRIAAVGLLFSALLISGAVAFGVVGTPGLADMQNSFGEVNEETTVIETDLVIHNPNPLGISLEDVSVNYTVSMNRIEMAHGQLGGIGIGSGNTTVELQSMLRNEGIGEWWTSHISAGEVTDVEIDLTITSERLGRSVDHTHETTIETDILSEFNSEETREVNANDPLTDDPVLYINETAAEWGAITESETPIEMDFRVFNPNLEPYVITRLGYEITMNDVPVGAGETQQEHVIDGQGHEEIGLTATIDANELDEWWVSHLDEDVLGHQVSELRIDFHAIIELPGGETVEVDLEPLTYEEIITTDFFEEGGDVGEAPADSNNEEEPEEDATDSEDEESEENESEEDDDGLLSL